MPRQGRSRSPHGWGWSTERISRTICMLGRYPDRRPPGLAVSAGGVMRLADLMHCWGEGEGLSQEEVLQAVRGHMFHDGASRVLRFAVDCNAAGDILIKVNPSRKTGYGAPCPTPARAGARSGRGGQSPGRPQSRAPRASNPFAAGRAAADSSGGAMQVDSGSQEKSSMGLDEKRGASAGAAAVKVEAEQPEPPTQAMSTESKLNMSLDEIISVGSLQHGGASAPAVQATSGGTPADSLAAKAQRTFHALGQMGCSADTRQRRSLPRNLVRDGGPQGVGRKQVERWLAWVLQSGYRQLEVRTWQGRDGEWWAHLGDIAAAMQRVRPHWRGMDVEGLRMLLEAPGRASGFEVVRDWIRQVGRLSPRGRGRAAPQTGRCANRSPSSERRRRHRSPSTSSPSQPPLGGATRDAELAAQSARTLQIPKVEIQSATEAQGLEVGVAGEGSPPPRPPGPGWQEFQEDGSEGRTWWYYEGPQGRWFVGHPDDDPLPYFEEEEDAED